MTEPLDRMDQHRTGPDGPPVAPAWPGLSGRLLILTVLFVMLSEVLIYVPSIANFRRNWLNDRIGAAQIAALVLDAAPAGAVPLELERKLVAQLGAVSVAMRAGGARRLLAVTDMPPNVEHNVDLRDSSPLAWITGAMDTLFSEQPRYIRIVGPEWTAWNSSRSCSTKLPCARRWCASQSTSCYYRCSFPASPPYWSTPRCTG